ncbi:UbiA prenyltransferase family-domain-containing protein [Aspergillus fruticulosus]
MPVTPAVRPSELPALVWAFTESNFSTFVLPNTAFGLLAVLAAPTLTDSLDTPSAWSLLTRSAPRMLLFNWANVFVFDLANQRAPASVVEDSLNKPWRPLPRGRISSEQTRRLMLGAIPAAVGISAGLGVGHESALCLLLTWMYCDLGGGDELTRDFLIGLGYTLALVTSLRIGIPGNAELSTTGYRWLGVLGGVVVTTMQVQDLKDQAGDRTRGRKTWPLVVGDTASRWWLAACLLFWSLACSLFWGLPLWGFRTCIPLAMGICVACCVLRRRADGLAWRLWCIWQVVLYSLPIMAQRHASYHASYYHMASWQNITEYHIGGQLAPRTTAQHNASALVAARQAILSSTDGSVLGDTGISLNVSHPKPQPEPLSGANRKPQLPVQNAVNPAWAGYRHCACKSFSLPSELHTYRNLCAHKEP